MTIYKYVPIDYFTYNRPEYYGCMLILILFSVFIIMLYLVFKYEYLKRIDYCDPMFYYGQPCRNQDSRMLLLNPDFLNLKKEYYNTVAKFNKETREYEGIRENTKRSKESVESSENIIEENLTKNKDFIQSTLDEIDKLTKVSNLIVSKYLGNLKELLYNVEKVPSNIKDGLVDLSKDLVVLKKQINKTIVNPVFKQYSAPLEKLYKSLTDIDKNTIPYLKK